MLAILSVFGRAKEFELARELEAEVSKDILDRAVKRAIRTAAEKGEADYYGILLTEAAYDLADSLQKAGMTVSVSAYPNYAASQVNVSAEVEIETPDDVERIKFSPEYANELSSFGVYTTIEATFYGEEESITLTFGNSGERPLDELPAYLEQFKKALEEGKADELIAEWENNLGGLEP